MGRAKRGGQDKHLSGHDHVDGSNILRNEVLWNGHLVEAPDASSILELMPDRSAAHSLGNHLVLVFLERGLSLGIFVELYTLVVSTAVLYHITALVAVTVMKNHRLAFLVVQASKPLASEF